MQYQWVAGVLTSGGGGATPRGLFASACSRTAIVGLSGFSQTGTGKLTGPDGNEQDTEDFLASLTVHASSGLTCCDSAAGNYDGTGVGTYSYPPSGTTGSQILFRVVTQKYGFGIVDRSDTCDSTGIIGLN